MLYYKQHTIAKSVTLSGVGLHTGIATEMTFLPAKPNHGIKFQRVDLPGSPIIDADCDNVVDVSRGTTLEQSGARVATVEHVLAALTGLEIDNVLIQLNAPETPIMDGSSICFINMIKEAELEEQNVPRNFYSVRDSIFHREPDRNVDIAALPLDDYRVTVMIDYNSPVLGSQHASITSIKQFEKEIAPARTFCFLHEVETLYKDNLIKGGSLDNAVVIVDRIIESHELDSISKMLNIPKVEVKENGILSNVELHYKNEPARHKLLDIMGDLALAGRPLKAQILAARPGHAANIALAKKLKSAMRKENRRGEIPYYNPNISPVLNTNQILKILQHRYPFLLIDKVIHLDEKTIIGIKSVTANESFFQGHFPNNMVMPGVLQIEVIAQLGAIFILNMASDPQNYWTYFLGIESFRFRKIVMPGDTLLVRCTLMGPLRRGIGKIHARAYVGESLVCEGTIIANMTKKSSHES